MVDAGALDEVKMNSDLYCNTTPDNTFNAGIQRTSECVKIQVSNENSSVIKVTFKNQDTIATILPYVEDARACAIVLRTVLPVT
jgi:hypothetical protein